MSASTSGQKLDAADPVAKLSDAQRRSLHRDARTGYLLSLLDALDVPVESQLLVFSKTGVQRTYTGPKTPRAVFFNESVAVGYVPGAPAIEIAASDPQKGMRFYTLDQTAATPAFNRQTSCLTCHVSAGTLNVPGMIARSHHVGDDGNVLARVPSSDVTHQTAHPDRWGGWFVTSEGAPPPYSQLAHLGNITFSERGTTSNQVLVDWLGSAPESHGYTSGLSDIVAMLVFDHQVHAINLIAKLKGEASATSPIVSELADYLLFVNEAGPLAPLVPRQGFAEHLASRVPKDRRGRSLAQLDGVERLMKYPCSYMVYSDAFDALPETVKAAVYRRMLEIVSGKDASARYAFLKAADRRAILEILRDTKPDFPATH
jgi:hypothetical protein